MMLANYKMLRILQDLQQNRTCVEGICFTVEVGELYIARIRCQYLNLHNNSRSDAITQLPECEYGYWVSLRSE